MRFFVLSALLALLLVSIENVSSAVDSDSDNSAGEASFENTPDSGYIDNSGDNSGAENCPFSSEENEPKLSQFV